ncbi:uridine kinase [Rugamonas sp. CCM 8940]|uniref:uridine kinase n=1 Tax=Rugamonas sp. CCM 8940 TaxID=2765359 RepID=UPI0018F311CD|nr:uridine kinase [Rugamonas sp. CCM 8940]MBJ7310439.1 uridine kinase [Rugamonas sp. CCM 8940]
MRRLFTHPLFGIGLALRLLMMALLVPKAAAEWYAPFMDASVAHFSLDPWGAFLAQGGAPQAFPYGVAMWLLLLPLTALAKLAGFGALHAYAFSLMAADCMLLLLLRRLLPERDGLLLALYWLSPIVLLATYGLGLNDLVPTLLLTAALWRTRQRRLFQAGALCAAAVSAKLSMVLALPFFLVYLLRNRSLRAALPDYLKGGALAGALLGLPFLASPAALRMLLQNPEMGKVYQFALQVGGDTVLYVMPLVYLLTLYLAWRVRRMNFDLFSALLGLGFLLVVLLTPASPGWFLWLVPTLVAYQMGSGRMAIALSTAFAALFVLENLPLPALSTLATAAMPASALQLPLLPLRHTVLTGLGIVLALRIWRETVGSNDYFRLSRKPFVIGIAGDSGAGKDTLAESLRGLFGGHSVAHLSGDDYHLWDRQKPMWQVMTHLSPLANDLESFATDLLALSDGKAILSRHYDHGSGKMSRPQHVASNDFIIASGLHALYLPVLRECYDLAIYLDIDESLRRYYKLQRDVLVRGHSAEKVRSSLAQREPDSARFVRPQARHAGLVLALQPVQPNLLEGPLGSEAPRVRLLVRSRQGLNELSLRRVLVGVCGLHVDLSMDGEASEITLTIEGEASAEDIAMAAAMLFPRIMEFLDMRPQWREGALGLMQLIALAHINQALSRRLLWQTSS